MDKVNPAAQRAVIPIERITRAILLIRGQKVMLDEALAALYEVEVKVLNQAVRRNVEGFSPDFMFQLTAEEAARLRSPIWDLKDRARTAPKIPALCIHGTRCRNAIQRAAQ